MIAIAAVFGLLAVFVAQAWLNSQAEQKMRSLEANRKPEAVRTIVVAGKPLRFGNELNSQSLREVPWPEAALPAGAFGRIADALAGGKRVVLTAIEANEPILSSKITGPGQRATLSAVLHDGMKAVTIRVNDVEGVAGFVLPGDRVDVVLTRPGDKGASTSDVVLQNTRVLAIDQIADERSDRPSVVKAVTFEVDIAAAQKVTLAASLGTLSLALRKAGEATAEQTRRITVMDLSSPSVSVAQEPKNLDGNLTTVTVTRAANKQEYKVPSEEPNGHVDNGGGHVASVGRRSTAE
jgi:pilus assembly protein CpaB